MNNKIFITNRTAGTMQAIIEDLNGRNILTRSLKPGSNEIEVTSLTEGTYTISLEDEHSHTFYQQKLVRE